MAVITVWLLWSRVGLQFISCRDTVNEGEELLCSLVDVKLPGKIPSSSAQLGHNFHHEERYSYQSGRLCAAHACDCVCRAAYAIGKKERPPFVPQEKPMSEPEEDPVPDELLCLICRDLLSDAVVIPCCGNSYCDDCESLRLPICRNAYYCTLMLLISLCL